MDSRRVASKFDGVRLMALALALAAIAGCSHERADASRLATLLAIRPGMSVADVGAGRGAIAIMMARLVGPKGRVFVSDINPRALDRVRKMVERNRLDNVTVVAAGARDAGLPARCCDAIFLRRVYHELPDTTGYNASLLRALRPGGDLAVLDFRPTSPWPWQSTGGPATSRGYGVDPVMVVNEVSGAGFEYIRMVDPWPGSWFISSYCVLFKKPFEAPAPPSATPSGGATPAAPPASASPPAS